MSERHALGCPADLFTPNFRAAPPREPGRPANEARSTARAGYRVGLAYRRFATGAEAVKFAIERLPPEQLARAVLEIEGERFDAGAIRGLYASEAYPLPRVPA
jgi:hypothetical protein